MNNEIYAIHYSGELYKVTYPKVKCLYYRECDAKKMINYLVKQAYGFDKTKADIVKYVPKEENK